MNKSSFDVHKSQVARTLSMYVRHGHVVIGRLFPFMFYFVFCFGLTLLDSLVRIQTHVHCCLLIRVRMPKQLTSFLMS